MRKLARCLIDLTAIIVTTAVVGHAYVWWAGMLAGVIVAIYGCWCFYDGITP